MTAKQMLQLLWARRLLFVSICGTLVGLVLLVSLILPKKYQGEVSVVIDSKSTNPVSGTESATELMPSNVATQADVIMSHNVALKVVNKLRLNEQPELRDDFQQATGGVGSIKDWLADWLLKAVEVKPSRESHVVNIDVALEDPNVAALVANEFATAFIQTSLELKAEPARRQAAWFQSQLQELRKTLEAAQSKLSDYQRTHNVVGTNEQIDVENGKLVEISNQLAAAEATMYDAQNRLKLMKQASLQPDQLQALPDILANPLLQSMKADLTRAESKLAETGERFGRNHPEYVSAAAEIKSLRAKLTAELETAMRAIVQTATQTSGQVAQLRLALNQQRDRILELKRDHDSVDLYRREVDTAQHLYDVATQRATETRLEGELDQSNISILNTAFPPSKPWRPKVVLNTAVAVVLAPILAAFTILVLENVNRRVRSSNDIVEVSGIVVLAEIPRRKRGRGRLRRRSSNYALLPPPGRLSSK
jgi:chain length determinant protein EpsF